VGIVDQLSSRVGDRTERSNRQVAARCLAEPALLAEVAGYLGSPDAALVGDCAEVLTKVAEGRPDLVAPYAASLAPLLGHRHTRARWEAMHALALVAPLVPDTIANVLPRLAESIRHDLSRIVRDYAIAALSAYGQTSEAAAQSTFLILKEALVSWDGKHTHQVLAGLAGMASFLPTEDLAAIAAAYAGHARPVVRRAAQALHRASQGAQ